jgi:hypothetical protein
VCEKLPLQRSSTSSPATAPEKGWCLVDEGASSSSSSILGNCARKGLDVWHVVDDYCGQAVGKLQVESMMSTAASLFPQ